ncbi:chorismate synthase [bacterium]|nr:chorismate synthase [bacterium]
MPGNSIGKLFRVSTWGESHGKAIGVLVDGCPPGIALNEKDIQLKLDKRKPKGFFETSRREEDKAKILSGVFKGKTTGMPISIIIWNKDSRSKDYEKIKDIYRPGHADYTYEQKYGIYDYRGGGRSSGRETVARVMAGAIAEKILSRKKISVIGHTIQIGEIKSEKFKANEIGHNNLKCADKLAAKEMLNLLTTIKKEKNSIGGIIELIIRGVPIGLGEPVFDKLDADLAKAIMSIGGVKGISIGTGFDVATKKGSNNNDSYEIRRNQVRTATNNAGGILGGISNGEDIIVHIAVKAPASIGIEQKSLNKRRKTVNFTIGGRHDTCIVPRIIPVAESMAAITITDHLLLQESNQLQ